MPPRLQWHKARNTYRVDIQGKTHYLGRDKQEAYRRYAELLLTPSETPKPLFSRLVLNHQPRVGPTTASLLRAVAPELSGHVTPAAAATLRRAVRSTAEKREWSRNTANKALKAVKHAVRTAHNDGLVSAEAAHAILLLPSFKRNECGVELERIGPVSDELVLATVPYLPSRIADMVMLQRSTGMRPGEVCSMRWSEIDTSETPWLYRPVKHKTAWAGKSRSVFIPVQGIAVLMKYRGEGPVFGIRRDSYTRRIAEVCKAHKLPRWSPNQLRHTAATELCRRFGVDVAAAVLGHSSPKTSEVYVQRDERAARTAMMNI